jgi:hypothetical protein
LNKRAQSAAAKAKAALEQTISAAKDAGLESPYLEPLAAEAMPRRGLDMKVYSTPIARLRETSRMPTAIL